MKKKQRKEMPGVLTAAEVRELTPRIAQMWAADLDPYAQGRKDKLAETARFATTCAWAAGAAVQDEQSVLDPLLDVLVDELAARERWELEEISETAGYLARKPDAARAKMLRLAGAEHHDLRSELIDFLDPERPEEAAVLEQLAATARPFHAARARQKLAQSKKRPWWDGRFAADPEEGLTQAQRKAGSRALRRLVKLLAPDDDPLRVARAKKDDEAARKAKAVELIATFPPRAALLAAEPLLARKELATEPAAKLWLDIARHPGAGAMFDRVAGIWAQGYFHRHADLFEAVEGKLPTAFLEEVAPLLLARLSREPLEKLRNGDGAVNVLTQMIQALWPPSLDAKPLADALLGWSEDEGYCQAATYLGEAIERGGAGRPWVRPLFEQALEHGFQGRFWSLQSPLEQLAESAFSAQEREALAWRALERGQDDQARRWAVGQLSEQARLAHFHDPRVRPELFDSALEGAVLARARAELRQGQLTAAEAGRVAVAITSIWGGRAPFIVFKRSLRMGDDDAPTVDEEQAAPVAAHDPAMAGPLTDAEWAELRRLRGSLPVAEAAADLDLGCLYPRGPWHPEDRAQFEAICRHIVETKDGRLAGFYAAIAATKSDAAHLPLLEELALLDDSEADQGSAAIERLRERMGLPALREDEDEEADPAQADGAGEEW